MDATAILFFYSISSRNIEFEFLELYWKIHISLSSYKTAKVLSDFDEFQVPTWWQHLG